MDNNREFVESVWEQVDVLLDEDMWKDAADFTRARLAEIKDVEEEIAYYEQYRKNNQRYFDCELIETDPARFQISSILTRTITRLQGILAEKKRGMK